MMTLYIYEIYKLNMPLSCPLSIHFYFTTKEHINKERFTSGRILGSPSFPRANIFIMGTLAILQPLRVEDICSSKFEFSEKQTQTQRDRDTDKREREREVL